MLLGVCVEERGYVLCLSWEGGYCKNISIVSTKKALGKLVGIIVFCIMWKLQYWELDFQQRGG